MKFIHTFVLLLAFALTMGSVNSQNAVLLGSDPRSFAIGDSCNGPGSIKYDDGSLANGGGWNTTVTDGRMVLKFTPNSYPWNFTKFCIALTRLSTGTANLAFDLVVYDTTGAAGAPGAVVATIAGQTATGILVFPAFSWFNFSTASVPALTSGSYYIGIKYSAVSQTGQFVMFDEAPTLLRTGYAWANAGPWTAADTYWATYRSWGMRTEGNPPAANTTLVLVHDSTVVTTQARRKQDRDSMRTYLGGIVGSYDLRTFDSSTVLPTLTQYNRIIIQETAFDGQPARYLGLVQRTLITAWLNTGTPGNYKRLYMLGGDLAYNYSRATSPGQDLTFAGTICGYTYRLDNAYPTPGNIIGINIDAGNTRVISNPPLGNYYPDGCGLSNGSIPLYRYGNHTAADTLAGVVRTTANYEVRSLFSDPAYFSGPGGFQPVLSALLGSLVGINPVGGVVPEVYTLSQNYPNPFNPVTNIKFSIPKTGIVKLVIFDVLGREVATLLNESKTAGNYVVDFDASMLSSGAYFYRLESGDFTETKKMLLVK